jgi:ribonuclease HI
LYIVLTIRPNTDDARVDATSGEPVIIWSAAMRHAHRSTANNQAEYRGLITGLRAARHIQWPQLEVVGDSALILRQLRDYTPPKNPRLVALYSQARRLADQI